MKEGTIMLHYDLFEEIEIYNNIPLNKPCCLSILMFNENDSIEIGQY